MVWGEVRNPGRPQQPICGSLNMILERDVFTPGDVITGIILLCVHTPAQNTELSISLQCEERLHSKYSDGEGIENEYRSHVFANLKYVLVQSAPAYCDSQVPFSIEIPPDLPKTTEIEYSSKYETLRGKLSIFYILTATLVVRDPGFDNSQRTLHVCVLPPPTARSIGKIVENQTTKRFRYAFWLKKSFCRVRVQLDSDVFSLGSTIAAHVWLDSPTPQRLKWTTLSLIRCIDRNSPTVSQIHRDRQAICSVRFTKAQLEDVSEFLLRLQVLSVPTEHEQDPLKPTSSFAHVAITYLVEVTTKMKGTRRIALEIPVRVELLDNDVAPVA